MTTTQLVGIPVGGYSYRNRPQQPSLEVLDPQARFCFLSGMLPQPRLDLPDNDCENSCAIGIFSTGSAGVMNIANLPALQRGPGTFDVLIDVFVPCGTTVPPTTLRMPNAVTYTSCTGDCDADGETAVNELVLGVNIALELETASRCLSYDQNGSGSVEINELVLGVSSLLEGCEQ